MKIIDTDECLTYDDILIRPNYSEILPAEACLETFFSKNIPLKIPLVSAAMDTVTESCIAQHLASLGGIGVIHKNLSPDMQAKEVEKVREAKVDLSVYPNATLDSGGALRVAGAVGIGDREVLRATLLAKAGVDAIVIDTAHGHSKGVLDMIQKIKALSFDVDIVAGNVATKEACLDLIKAGVDAVKVGIGPGSICTTRIVAGIGVPQVTAISECYEACRDYNIPFIADGGVKFSGDIVKAIGLGASSIMLGSLFASTYEAPGEIITSNGVDYKSYRGMGSLGAMVKGSKDRYGQGDVTDNKLVPEGVEGMVLCRGHIDELIFQLIGGIRSGMGYVGAKTIAELKEKAKFIRISKASYKESHVHDITIIKDAPNYNVKG